MSSEQSVVASRNEVPEANAAWNREHGGYTFNAFPPDDYDGVALVYACVRLGDHAHVEVYSGRNIPSSRVGWHTARLSYGYAGHLVLRWPEWLAMRDMLEMVPFTRVVEVEYPSTDEVMRYVKGQGDEQPTMSREEAARLWSKDTPPPAEETCS